MTCTDYASPVIMIYKIVVLTKLLYSVPFLLQFSMTLVSQLGHAVA
jgi:hypothetical protein